ncbi:MAG: LytTR family DNA-binding domain-containing protein [Bacteroidota bacterium]
MTKQLRSVAIDDELAFLKTIKNIVSLKEHSPIELVGEGRSVKEAISVIQSTEPDLIFLDIRLPDGSGFDVLKAFPDSSFKVIFITAYNEYAIKAFRYSALDYLLKPIHSEVFWDAVKKVEENVSRKDLELQIELLMKNLGTKEKEPSRDKILLKEGENIHLVKVQDIAYCEANGSYTKFFFLGEDPILVCHHLKDYEDVLAENGFIRTHRSYLINKNLIKRFDKSEGGSIYLQDGSQIPVSHRKKEEILGLLSEL